MRMGSGQMAFAAALLLSQGVIGATCVDGVTPDCSEPDAACGPALDATADEEASILPEASADAVGGDAGDASSDADAGDAASDAPDGG